MVAYYVFVATAGRWTQWPNWTGTYDAQASALLQGHLHLLEQPSAELMALPNPWDPANMRYWRWDLSYFQGHLDLYWGLVPAFIAAGVRAIFRVPHVGDNGLVFAFMIIRLVAGTLIIRDVARNAAHRPARWVVALAMLVFALANPTPYTLARAAVYEAAIMGGAAFMLAGLYLANRAMIAARDGVAAAWLAGASLSFGLAAGCRLNLFPAAAALAAAAGFWRWRQGEGHDGRRLVKVGAAAVFPAAAIMFGHLIINKLRFGEWSEFGRSYVMTSPLLSPGLRFFLPDSYAYVFAPPQLTCGFPYLHARWDMLRAAVPGWLAPAWPADHYGSEPTAGLLTAAPVFLFALAAPVFLFALARARLRSRSGPGDATAWSKAPFAAPQNWLWAALAIYLVGSAPLLFLKVATMRYENDFASGLLLIAIFGSWRLLASPASARGRRVVAWIYGALAVSTIVAGVLLGFTGYFDHFKRHNPDLYYALSDGLSLCRRR